MIRLDKVKKVFDSEAGPVVAVNEVSLTVAEGETLCLIGTSGSGKTTCMKMINRLLEPTSGVIEVGGKNVLEVNPIRLRRSIGYVIQKAGLLPHMTVAANVGLLCRLEKWSAKATNDRVRELLELVNMEPDEFMHRYPRELSGGQQQRVGVARALALDPATILMDEPFGALDPITREMLHDEFLRLKQEVKKTIVIVTHDLAEAFKLGDRIALMDQGQLVQVGTEDEFRYHPQSDFAEQFVQSHVSGPAELVKDSMSPEPASDSAPRVALEATLKEALALLLEHQVERLNVVDEEDNVVGSVSGEELLACLP